MTKIKEQCISKSATHRLIQERGSKLSIKMKYKMSTTE